MNAMETWIVLIVVALSAGYLLRGIVRIPSSKSCTFGCGACRKKDCALRKLEARLKEDAAR